jgi:drug/metabolite transporter (DMT)-like permease
VVTLLWLTAGVSAIYLVVIALRLYVLRSLELNRAFAFASLAFIFVPAFSYFLLGEKITIGTVAGAMLIIGGILISANF